MTLPIHCKDRSSHSNGETVVTRKTVQVMGQFLMVGIKGLAVGREKGVCEEVKHWTGQTNKEKAANTTEIGLA